jgi:LacI family transcriptional regulator
MRELWGLDRSRMGLTERCGRIKLQVLSVIFMQRKKFPKVSLRTIAAAAGVSKTTVSYVLRNSPGPAKRVREHVLRTANRLGYVPDPRISSWMAQIRDAKEKSVVPIVWLTLETALWDKYKFLSPYLQGARERAHQLGYRIEPMDWKDPAMSITRMSQIIYHQGIEGVIVTHVLGKHVKLRWDSLAAVGLEGRLMAPRLHRVKADIFHNLLLALKMVRRFGYQRIGICLENIVDRGAYNGVEAAIFYFQSKLPKTELVPHLFFSRKGKNDRERAVEVETQVVPWLLRNRPDVIVGQHNDLEKLVTNAGFRVPEDVGIVHLSTDDDVSDWAGIHSKRREIGAAAIDQVVTLMQNRQFGIPRTPMSVEIAGLWKNGRTLLTPTPIK